MGKLRVFVAAAVVLVAVGLYAPGAEATARRAHRPNQLVRVSKSNAPEYSINWSGYAVEAKAGEAITAVSGAWHVPKIDPAPPGFSSSWIGIGGFRTQDLIQVGTASSGSIEGNYAWYEMLPDFETRITSGCAGDPTCAVTQADRIAASVTNVGGDTWQIMLANLGTGARAKWHWAKTFTYKSSFSSAEFVFEAPQIGVSIPGVVTVAGIQTFPANAPHAKFLGGTLRVNGINRSLATAGARRVIMVVPRVTDRDPGPYIHTATPSFMAPDGHFQVCTYKRTCPNF